VLPLVQPNPFECGMEYSSLRIQINVSKETFISEVRLTELNKTSYRPEYRREENQDRLVITTNQHQVTLFLSNLVDIRTLGNYDMLRQIIIEHF